MQGQCLSFCSEEMKKKMKVFGISDKKMRKEQKRFIKYVLLIKTLIWIIIFMLLAVFASRLMGVLK